MADGSAKHRVQWKETGSGRTKNNNYYSSSQRRRERFVLRQWRWAEDKRVHLRDISEIDIVKL